MLKIKKQKQGYFIQDTDIYEKLIPEDHEYRKIKDLVAPLFREEDFKDMYCQDNGRPARSPAMMSLALLIQMKEDLSDRETEDFFRYDLRGKYLVSSFLGVEESPFDHSSLGDFRDRLRKFGKEKEVFDRMQELLCEAKLIQKRDYRRLDTTHMIGKIAIPSSLSLIRQGIKGILKELETKSLKGEISLDFGAKMKELKLEEYVEEGGKNKEERNLDGKKLERVFVNTVLDAKEILDFVRGNFPSLPGALGERVEILERILQENVKEETGIIKELPKKEKLGDRIVSCIDPDVRFGRKNKDFPFTGYKVTIEESIPVGKGKESRESFITNVSLDAGNVRDDQPAFEVVSGEPTGLVPPKVIADSIYATGENLRKFKEAGIKLVADPKEASNPTSLYPQEKFRYDKKRDCFTCPAKKHSLFVTWDRERGIKIYHFGKSCQGCRRRRFCTEATGGRTISLSSYHEELAEARIYARTEKFREEMKLRSPLEGTFSELVRKHGMRFARYWGKKKNFLQVVFSALVVNVKRLLKMLKNPLYLVRFREALRRSG